MTAPRSVHYVYDLTHWNRSDFIGNVEERSLYRYEINTNYKCRMKESSDGKLRDNGRVGYTEGEGRR